MFRNYFAAALRNLARNRLYAAINIVGLAVGLAAAMLALLYLRFELSYDRFITGSDRIHMVVIHFKAAGQGELVVDGSPSQFFGWLKADFPDLEVTRLQPTRLTVRRNEIEATEAVGWGEPNLFALLRMPVVAGDPVAALERPDGLVLTRAMARKYFGEDAPLGKTLEFERQHVMHVAAVIEDMPPQTHLTPAIYGSSRHAAFGPVRLDEKFAGFNGNVQTYLAPPPGVAAEAYIDGLRAGFPAFMDRHMGEIARDPNVTVRPVLVPLNRLHLYPSNYLTMKPHGNPDALAMVGGAGLLILLVTGINFTNLMTARAMRRAVEVGVRKVSGAGRWHLLGQFIGEALLYAGAGAIVALAIVELLLPLVRSRLVEGLATDGFSIAMLGMLAAVLGAFAALYPAVFLAGLRPNLILRNAALGGGSSGARYYLVAVQFGLLVALLIGSLVIQRQTEYVLGDGLRVVHEQVLLIHGPCRAALVTELRAVSGVQSVACSGPTPLNMNEAGTQARRAGGPDVSVIIAGTGFGFFELYEVPLLAGRSFDEVRPGDANSSDPKENLRAPIMINESAVHSFGFASPQAAVGQTLSIRRAFNTDPPLEIIGVVADHAFDLLRRAIPPTLYNIHPLDQGIINVRLAGGDLAGPLAAIDAAWQRAGDPRPISRLFLDRHLESLSAQVIRQGRLAVAFSSIALFIAALGLFGLAAFTAERRTKEIGIRKAMGAGAGEILRLLLWQFARPVLWANLIAWPVAFFVMRRWLQGFAYHIDLAPWMFLAAGGAALAIALVTVAGHALLVARTRPVLALRYE